MSNLVVKLLTRILENAKPECAVYGWSIRKVFESDEAWDNAVESASRAGYVGFQGLTIWVTGAGATALAEHHRRMLDRNPGMTAAIDLAITEGFEVAE